MTVPLHVLSDSRFVSHVTVSQFELDRASLGDGLMQRIVYDLARQMADNIVRKRITSDFNEQAQTRSYRMDVYVLSPDELTSLVHERAKQMIGAGGPGIMDFGGR